MIARLFNAPSHDDANTIGTSTIGSSEAIMVSTQGQLLVEDSVADIV
jgi:glutamate/tyrosine decarboxylase-like PLP-dependent enzyme